MNERSNNPPDFVIELTKDQHAFLLDNCESNMKFALAAMSGGAMSRDGLVKLVELNEKFKAIRDLLKKAER